MIDDASEQRDSARGGPPETAVRSVPVPTTDDEDVVVVEQEPSGLAGIGSGDQPPPGTPPTAPEDLDDAD